ncbi:MAG: hypothetical protein ACR2L2_19480 [Acidobacteriota bacterium]
MKSIHRNRMPQAVCRPTAFRAAALLALRRRLRHTAYGIRHTVLRHTAHGIRFCGEPVNSRCVIL